MFFIKKCAFFLFLSHFFRVFRIFAPFPHLTPPNLHHITNIIYLAKFGLHEQTLGTRDTEFCTKLKTLQER